MPAEAVRRVSTAELRAVRPEDLLPELVGAGVGRSSLVGLCLTQGQVSMAYEDRLWVTSTTDPAAVVLEAETALGPRWVWWSSQDQAMPLVARGVRPAACWDLAAVHRLLRGGWADDPARVWALVAGLPEEDLPEAGQLDLLAGGGPVPAGAAGAVTFGVDDPDSPVQPDGYLRPECWTGSWLSRSPVRPARWAALGCWVATRQLALLAERSGGGDPRTTTRSESAAALLSVELGLDGLPLRVQEAERVIAGFIGPRPRDEADRMDRRRERDAVVLAHARGASADLRNPAQVRQLLADVGVTVPDTRSWRLEPFRDLHPVVDALLQWRKAERMETTYGYAWLDRQVVDGRLRGRWHASDGAAGRMTAQAGLHNLPAELP